MCLLFACLLVGVRLLVVALRLIVVRLLLTVSWLCACFVLRQQVKRRTTTRVIILSAIGDGKEYVPDLWRLSLRGLLMRSLRTMSGRARPLIVKAKCESIWTLTRFFAWEHHWGNRNGQRRKHKQKSRDEALP